MHSYPSTKCAPFLLKIGKDLTLMIKRAKGLKFMKFVFIIDLNTFSSKVFLTPKIMDFEIVPLIKVVHVYVIKDMNAYYT